MSAPPSAPGSPSRATIAEYNLTGGPRWYRDRIRVVGPFLALLIPGVLGALSYAALHLSDARWSGPVGLIGGFFAGPALLAVGAPFGNRELYPVAVGASAVMWFLIGMLAARRATRNPMATFGDFWRHYSWMLCGVWVGVIVALAVATVRLGNGVVDW